MLPSKACTSTPHASHALFILLLKSCLRFSSNATRLLVLLGSLLPVPFHPLLGFHRVHFPFAPHSHLARSSRLPSPMGRTSAAIIFVSPKYAPCLSKVCTCEVCTVSVQSVHLRSIHICPKCAPAKCAPCLSKVCTCEVCTVSVQTSLLISPKAGLVWRTHENVPSAFPVV